MEQEQKEEKGMTTKGIAQAVIIAGILIAGAILIKGTSAPELAKPEGRGDTTAELAIISPSDEVLGNPKASVSVIVYEDFQCPYCGAISGLHDNTPAVKYLKQIDPSWTPFMPGIMENYVNKGTVQFVYRDYPFLGPESYKASQAANCAKDQGKFWEYHDYLYANQNGENEGAFSDQNLKSFAGKIGLDQTSFDSCFNTGKYTEEILSIKNKATSAGVAGTPKGFIIKDGKIVDTIDGAISFSAVKEKLNRVLGN